MSTTSHLSPPEVEFDPKALVKPLPHKPGVYQMLGEQGELLYVGKAKNLKKRVSSYFRSSGLPPKTRALVSRIRRVEITVTASDTEALLLEQNLIKDERPPFNILLRDDKSYPYIYVGGDHTYPSLTLRRTRSKVDGRYFGPFPSAGSVRESLNLLQKIFQVRQCEESFFKNRSRPCLQYQIKRCSGPCVKAISAEAYQADLRRATMFIEGRNPDVLKELITEMETASAQLDFERAAALRDQLNRVRHVQEQQAIEGADVDADIIAVAMQPGGACVQMLYVRKGKVLGSKSWYPAIAIEMTAEELLGSFLAQYYLGGHLARDMPKEIILSHAWADEQTLADGIAERTRSKVRITASVRGDRLQWQRMAQTNAEQNLNSYLANKQNLHQRYVQLQDLLSLEQMPTRMECFDISHTAGEATVASCVVFDLQGPVKSDYRRFNIEGETASDDYAAMRQALQRRYTRIKKGEGRMPDLIVVDGGKGQMSMAQDVLETLQVHDTLLLGIAKGPTRKAGFERLFLSVPGEEGLLEIDPPPDSPALMLLQQIRDEAHRFAITGHRQRRSKARGRSTLQDIPGVGPKRRRELLKYFGGMQQIEKASAHEIAKVPGVSSQLANAIYTALHPNS